MMQRNIRTVLAISLGLAATVQAQNVISAKSGLVHYTEGEVYLGDKAIDVQPTEFPQVEEKQVLRTGLGRAEVLLTPGVFLRIAENTAVRMISNRLVDTRIELIDGSALIEVAELEKDNSITMIYQDAEISFRKSGLFRIDSEPARFRTYQGEAVVTMKGQALTLKEGRQTSLAAVLASEKFDTKVGDAFYRWASRRAGYISDANLAAARKLHESGLVSSSSSWLWNPFLGMFTYLPLTGSYWSPFGYRYYSPAAVYAAYAPPQRPVGFGANNPGMMDPMGARGYGDRGGMGGYSRGGSVGSVSGAAPPSAPSAPAPAAPPRGAASGGPRGSGGR